MRTTVIGGSGFIGTRLVGELLRRGHDVVNLDLRPSSAHPDVTTIGDVCEPADVRTAVRGADVVVNLAAEHRDDVRPVERYTAVNVGGARTLAAAVEAEGVQRLVFTSSVAVYGLGRPHPAEDAPARPFNEYGRTKLEAEGVLRAWAGRDPSRRLEILRPCVVFGEGNRGNVHTLAAQIASGRFLMIGGGANRKSMAYVGNVADWLAGAVEGGAAPGVRTTNYADGPDLTTRELVDLVQSSLAQPGGSGPRVRRSLPLPVGLAAGLALDGLARVSGRTFPVSAVRVRKFAAETTVDTARLRSSGFVPAYALTDALRRTLAAEFPRETP